MVDKELIYLETYVLQQDMKIRMLKNILENLNVDKGVSKFRIFYNKTNQQLVLTIKELLNIK